MSSFVPDAALAAAASCSFVLVGMAVLKWMRAPFTGLEGLAVGTALGVLCHALLGLVVALSPAKPLTASILFLVLWSGSGWKLLAARADRPQDKPAFPWTDTEVRWTSGILIGFICGCVVITHLQIRFPPVLPDGTFIFKEHTLPVKMQVLTGSLPVDNYLPFVAEEYLLHDISFTHDHPIIPGQEVTNRPLLLALAVLPFRAALDWHPLRFAPLGRFRYVGRDWPDTGVFMEGPGFREFLVVGIVLNALVLLGGALVIARQGARPLLVPGLLLLATSPFYLVHALFTWPKSLAAFYLLLALHFLACRRSALWVALWGALAYYSHPYALVFLFGFGCHYLVAAWPYRQRSEVRPLVGYGAAVALLLAPWFAWAYLFLRIPSNLISQNLIKDNAGTAFSQVWARLYNLSHILSAGMLGVFPFNTETVFRQTMECLPGVLGLLTVPAYFGLLACFRTHRIFVVQGIIAPALLLALPFSVPVPLMLVAYHAVGICCFLLGLILLARLPRRVGWAVITAQILLQLALLAGHARALGAAFAGHGLIYRLLDHRPEVTGALHAVNFHVDLAVGEDHVESIWSEPPAALVYHHIPLPAAPVRFHGRIAIHPQVWALGGTDGAEFDLEVRPVGQSGAAAASRRVWSAFLDPLHRPEQRAWVPVDVDLSAFAGQTVDLTLRNGAGPANNDYGDWCIWGDPRLEQREAPSHH